MNFTGSNERVSRVAIRYRCGTVGIGEVAMESFVRRSGSGLTIAFDIFGEAEGAIIGFADMRWSSRE